MTNKNDSVKPIRIRINPRKLNCPKPTGRPTVPKLGTRDDGGVVIKRGATERRPE
jgi:hypothetical protein